MQITRNSLETVRGPSGAAPNRLITHLAMIEVDDTGNAADWGEHVTDEEYNAS